MARIRGLVDRKAKRPSSKVICLAASFYEFDLCVLQAGVSHTVCGFVANDQRR